MEVPFSRNPPQLSVVPQIDPRYADMAIGEAYSAYNEKALFKDTEISQNLVDARQDLKLAKLTDFFDSIHKQEQEARASRGATPEDTAGRGLMTQTPTDTGKADLPTTTRGQTPR